MEIQLASIGNCKNNTLLMFILNLISIEKAQKSLEKCDHFLMDTSFEQVEKQTMSFSYPNSASNIAISLEIQNFCFLQKSKPLCTPHL